MMCGAEVGARREGVDGQPVASSRTAESAVARGPKDVVGEQCAPQTQSKGNGNRPSESRRGLQKLYLASCGMKDPSNRRGGPNEGKKGPVGFNQ